MRNSNGKIVVPREILAKIEAGKSPSCRNLFLWILINANFKDATFPIKLGKKMQFLRKGEILTSHKELAKQANLSISGCRQSVRYMVSLGVISTNSYDKKGILIKINDYEGLIDLKGDNEQLGCRVKGQEEAQGHDNMSGDIRTKENKELNKYNVGLERDFSNFKQIWNNELCPPFAQIGTVNKKRISDFKKVRHSFSLDEVLLTARHMAEQDFFKTKFKLTVDNFLRPTKFIEKFERAKATHDETNLTKDEYDFLKAQFYEVNHG